MIINIALITHFMKWPRHQRYVHKFWKDTTSHNCVRYLPPHSSHHFISHIDFAVTNVQCFNMNCTYHWHYFHSAEFRGGVLWDQLHIVQDIYEIPARCQCKMVSEYWFICGITCGWHLIKIRYGLTLVALSTLAARGNIWIPARKSPSGRPLVNISSLVLSIVRKINKWGFTSEYAILALRVLCIEKICVCVIGCR